MSDREYTVQRESLSTCLEEAKPLLLQHWEEIAVNHDIPLNPDYRFYHSLEAAGILRVYTIRCAEGVLVGYAVYFLRRHIHYSDHTWAIADIIMVRPEHRNAGLGFRLFDFIERDLRDAGATVIHTTSKVDHPELGWLLSSRGHKKIEEGYSLRLK